MNKIKIDPKDFSGGFKLDVDLSKSIPKVKHDPDEHDWLIVDTVPYRDIDGKKFIQDIYTCHCGAGGFIRTPLEQIKKGNRSMDFILKEAKKSLL